MLLSQQPPRSRIILKQEFQRCQLHVFIRTKRAGLHTLQTHSDLWASKRALVSEPSAFHRSRTLTFPAAGGPAADLGNLFIVRAAYLKVYVAIPKASITWYLMTA